MRRPARDFNPLLAVSLGKATLPEAPRKQGFPAERSTQAGNGSEINPFDLEAMMRKLTVYSSFGAILVALVVIQLFEAAVPKFRLNDDPVRQSFVISNPSAYLTLHDVRWHCKIGETTVFPQPQSIEIAPRTSINAACFPGILRVSNATKFIVQYTTLGIRRAKSEPFH
jgi:hypothetical protein